MPDVSLNEFRRGVAVLRADAEVVGHLATIVEPFRGPGGRRERVWLLVTWVDGRRDRIEEDYPPWTSVAEICRGFLTWTIDDRETKLEVAWLEGDSADEAWERYGIHDEVGHYL